MSATAHLLPTKELTRWLTLDLIPDLEQPRKFFSEKSLKELAHSLTTNGQLVPLIVSRDPTNERRAIIADGERRWRAALRCAQPMESLDVIVLPEKPNAMELLKTQLAVNQFRESFSLKEEYAAYVKLMTEDNLTQLELSTVLGISPSKVSKVLSRNRIAPELLEQVERLDASVVPLIAQISQDQQPELVAFATTQGESGRRPTRDQVQAYLKAKKQEPKRSGRMQHFTGKIGNRHFRVSLSPDDSHDTLVDSLKQLIAFLKKHDTVPVGNLSILASAL
jgi:ParB/RepB/Spo0J family partition protein